MTFVSSRIGVWQLTARQSSPVAKRTPNLKHGILLDSHCLTGRPRDAIVSLVAFHSEAVVEAEERGLLAELSAFGRPPEDELDLLTFADMTTNPLGLPTDVDQRISEILSRYEPGSPVHGAVTRSQRGLRSAVARTMDRIRATDPHNTGCIV